MSLICWYKKAPSLRCLNWLRKQSCWFLNAIKPAVFLAPELSTQIACLLTTHRKLGQTVWLPHSLSATKAYTEQGCISINALHAIFFRRNKDIYLHFISFLHTDMIQGIRNHDIGYVKPNWFGFRMLRVKMSYCKVLKSDEAPIPVFRYVGSLWYLTTISLSVCQISNSMKI